MGARVPEAPKAFPRATNIINKEPEWAPKISDYDYLMGLGIPSNLYTYFQWIWAKVVAKIIAVIA